VKGAHVVDTGTDLIWTTKVRSPVQGDDCGISNLNKDVGYPGYGRTLSAKRRMRAKGGDEQKNAQPTMIVVIEQWICFVLGLVCMAFGIWGICMKPEQDVLSAYVAWLGSLYVPTLRVTAFVCVGLGVMLIRRG
jgi:hypothetical protein